MLVLIYFLLGSCKTRDYFFIEDSNLYLKNEFCNHQDKLGSGSIRRLQKHKIITSIKEPVHLQVLFKGKNDNAIVLVNCNAGFQGPKYLGFYSDAKLKIIKNSLNLELLYKEFKSFSTTNDSGPEESAKIWNYIHSFVDQELLNKYNKINW